LALETQENRPRALNTCIMA